MKQKYKSLLTIIYLIVISILEILAYKIRGTFSIVAAWLWIFTGLTIFGFLIYGLVHTLYEDIKNKNYLIIGAYVLLLLFFISFIGNIAYSDISYEAAIQVNAGLESFTVPDLNYTKTAFLGYPNRQYVLVAIPAFIFGRSIWTLHAGYGSMFLIGISALYLELRKTLEQNKIKEEYALIVPYTFISFRFITEYFMNFEQTIIPVALTMFGIASYLRLRRDLSYKSFIYVSWIGGFLGESYTPSLASLGLLVVFLALYMIEYFFIAKGLQNKDKPIEVNKTKNFYRKILDKFVIASNQEKIIKEDKLNNKKEINYKIVLVQILVLILCICTFFIATIIPGRADRIDNFNNEKSIVQIAFEALEVFFMNYSTKFFGIFTWIIIFYMVLSILCRFKVQDFVISIWILGVVFFANYVVGYTKYEGMHLIQRCMIVIPVLMTSIFVLVIRFIEKYNVEIKTKVLIFLLLFFMITGIYNFQRPHQSFVYFQKIQPIKYVISYVQDTMKEYNLKSTDDFYFVLYTNNRLEGNTYDYAKFFFPKAKTVAKFDKHLDKEILKSKFVIMISENESLDNMTTSNNSLYNIVKEAKTDTKVYSNKRYKEETILYRKVIDQR